MLVECIWLDEKSDCSDLFEAAKSVMGICCSFNYNGVKENLRLYVVIFYLFATNKEKLSNCRRLR
jgi:hypothetical protein